MGYQPNPPDQWDESDLAAASAARDYRAIDAARRAGHLRELLQVPSTSTDEAAQTPAGPTVTGQQPGGHAPATGPISEADIDRLAAAGNYAEVNRLRRNGDLDHLI